MKICEMLSNPWDLIGFSIRSDHLWPMKMFESSDSGMEFNRWLDHQRDIQSIPDKNSECVLAMVVNTGRNITVFYGKAEYIGQSESHYQLRISSGTHQYSKNNQLVFDSDDSFQKFIMLLTLMYQENGINIEVTNLPVMETKFLR